MLRIGEGERAGSHGPIEVGQWYLSLTLFTDGSGLSLVYRVEHVTPPTGPVRMTSNQEVMVSWAVAGYTDLKIGMWDAMLGTIQGRMQPKSRIPPSVSRLTMPYGYLTHDRLMVSLCLEPESNGLGSLMRGRRVQISQVSLLEITDDGVTDATSKK